MHGFPSSDRLARHWDLDSDVVFLNHGSFGACPRSVLEAQTAMRRRMEAEPVRFFVRELPDLLDAARERLAQFMSADPGGLAWVSNATTGVNTVLASFPLRPGDEILVTDHEYVACRNAVDRWSEHPGATVSEVRIPFPLDDPEIVVEAVRNAVTPRTRLLLIDHVTSQTGLVFPVARVIRELEDRGIAVLVDGAHAPGMVDLRIDDLGCSFYVGNCHKWLCAPKGAAFLWVREDHRKHIRPLVTSHGATLSLGDATRFRLEFDWLGTDDPTAFLAVPDAIDTMASMVEGGWPEIRRRNRTLALAARDLLCEALDIPAPCPDSMIGSLAAVPIPDGAPRPSDQPAGMDPLQERLWTEYAVEVPVITWPDPPRRLLRIAAQLYNSEGQYRYLAGCLRGR